MTTDYELEKEQKQKWECEYELLMKQCEQLHEQLRAKDKQLNESSQSYRSLELQCQTELERAVSICSKMIYMCSSCISCMINQLFGYEMDNLHPN